MEIITERRLRALEETLTLLEETRTDYERKIAAATEPAQKLDGKSQLQVNVLTPIEKYRSEYFQLLVESVDETRIPPRAAEIVAAEVIHIIDQIETLPTEKRFANASAFQEMLTTLRDMRARFNAPEKTATEKLKAELPRLPTLVKYEIEVDADAALHPLKQIPRKPVSLFRLANPC